MRFLAKTKLKSPDSISHLSMPVLFQIVGSHLHITSTVPPWPWLAVQGTGLVPSRKQEIPCSFPRDTLRRGWQQVSLPASISVCPRQQPI